MVAGSQIPPTLPGMSKATIFTDLCQRNALRREAGLPLLDMTTEYAREQRREAQAAYHLLRDQHRDVLERMKREVLAEKRQEHGPGYGGSMSGMRAVATLAEKRFATYLAGLGVARPPPVDPPVVYGEAKAQEPP